MVAAESSPDPASTAGIRPVTFCRCSAAFTCWFLLCAWVFIAPSGFLDKVAVSLKCCQCVFPECSSAAASAGKEWEEYLQIRGLVERIRKKQKGKYMYSIMLTHDWDLHTHPIGLNDNNLCFVCVCSGMSIVFEGSREEHFPDLMSWAKENGASCECFTVANFGKEGYGLRATRDIKVSTLIFLEFWSYLLLHHHMSKHGIFAFYPRTAKELILSPRTQK